MELKDFIEQSLVQIFEGVSGAQKRAKVLGAEVNPAISSPAPIPIRLGSGHQEIQTVQFDVAATVIEGKEKGGRIGVIASVLDIGGEMKKVRESENVHRIKFGVPIQLPKQ